jgi:glycosyltransferase involved in cell wall biosynthesis
MRLQHKPISILHVISSADRTGGGPIEGILQLNGALARLGHDSEIVSLDAPDAPWLADMPLKVHALGPAVSSYRYAKGLVPWLRTNAGRYDHVIVNGLWQYHSFATRRALRPLGIPYALYTHGMLDPWFKTTYPLKHFKKSLYWPWGEYPVLRDAQAVCFTCEEERVLARQSFARYQCCEAVVNYGTSVPTGDRDAQRRAFYDAHPTLVGKRLLLFLSRIHVKKGCDLLLDAFAQVAASDPALHLVMAGPDQTGLQAGLQAQAERLGIADRITWPGMLTGDLKWGAFHAADAFVLPSHQENFGIAVAEALACGLPVLISDKVNIWREIDADGAGLVAPDTNEGTADLLRRWLALSPTNRDQMRQTAVQCFTSRFEITQAAHSLLCVLSAKETDRQPCLQS